MTYLDLQHWCRMVLTWSGESCYPSTATTTNSHGDEYAYFNAYVCRIKRDNKPDLWFVVETNPGGLYEDLKQICQY